MPSLLLATTNPGKLAELRALLADIPGLTVLSPSELPHFAAPVVDETAETFAGNALLKATAYARAAGIPALADDSGLCVDALGGEPGVRSARWAGEHLSDTERTDALLRRMEGVAEGSRAAYFVSVTVVAHSDGSFVGAEGICEGQITNAPRGSGGFGYDPILSLPQFGRTLAELSPDEKNKISHRSQAIRLLMPLLADFLKTQV